MLLCQHDELISEIKEKLRSHTRRSTIVCRCFVSASCRCMCVYALVCMRSVRSVSAWMRVNGALQARWHSIEDECADMTVIHGDVYSKPRDSSSGGLKTKKKAKWKTDSACRMFLLNSVEKFGQVYIYDGRQFSRLYSDAAFSLLCMISLEECSYYVNWQCSVAWLAHAQRSFKQPTHSPNTYTSLCCRPHCSWMSSLSCWNPTFTCMWQSKKLSEKTQDSREIIQFPFSNIMDSLIFPCVY